MNSGQSICLSMSMGQSVCLSVCLSMCMINLCLSVCLFICPCVSICFIVQVKTLAEFDEKLVVPMFGYNDRFEYYMDASTSERLKHISVPYLAMNAGDDPFAPHFGNFYVSVCLPVCPSVLVSVCLPVHVSVCLPVHVSVCLSVHVSVCPSVCLPICPCVCLSVCPCVCLPICPSACLSMCCLPVCPCVCLSVCPCVCLPVHLPSCLYRLHHRLSVSVIHITALHSLPIVSSSALPTQQFTSSQYTALLTTTAGGHIGFADSIWPSGPTLVDKIFAEFSTACFEHGNELKAVN